MVSQKRSIRKRIRGDHNVLLVSLYKPKRHTTTAFLLAPSDVLVRSSLFTIIQNQRNEYKIEGVQYAVSLQVVGLGSPAKVDQLQ